MVKRNMIQSKEEFVQWVQDGRRRLDQRIRKEKIAEACRAIDCALFNKFNSDYENYNMKAARVELFEKFQRYGEPNQSKVTYSKGIGKTDINPELFKFMEEILDVDEVKVFHGTQQNDPKKIIFIINIPPVEPGATIVRLPEAQVAKE